MHLVRERERDSTERNAIFHHLTCKPLLERKRSKVQPIFGIDETLMFKEVISISSHLPSLLQCWHLLKYFRRYFDIYISIAWHGHILHINPNRVWNIKYQDFFSIFLKYRYFWRFWMRWMFSSWIRVGMVHKVGNPFNLWFSTSRSKNISILSISLYLRFGNGSSIKLKRLFLYFCQLIYVDIECICR